jgi:hypothetical protein
MNLPVDASGWPPPGDVSRSSGAPQRGWRGPLILFLVCLAAIGIATVATVWRREGRATWRHLDQAAESFDPPAGFREVARVRTGTTACFISCSGDGGAVVTIVYETDANSPESACAMMRTSVEMLAGEAEADRYAEPCAYIGPLGGPSRIYASADSASNLRNANIQPWMAKIPVPESQVVAFVEFNSGIT